MFLSDSKDITMRTKNGKLRLPEFLRQQMNKKDLNQHDMAGLIGISPGFLNQLLSGARKGVSFDVAVKIAKATGADLEHLHHVFSFGSSVEGKR
jgi:transcriptional regulator with XRE-family HTH domain